MKANGILINEYGMMTRFFTVDQPHDEKKDGPAKTPVWIGEHDEKRRPVIWQPDGSITVQPEKVEKVPDRIHIDSHSFKATNGGALIPWKKGRSWTAFAVVLTPEDIQALDALDEEMAALRGRMIEAKKNAVKRGRLLHKADCKVFEKK